jgi:branched-subunit amino acid ABC-type transport system permease component
MVSLDLLANAIVSGVLLGGFYAGVAAGATISFGLLDVANIAHPAFVVFGAYGAFLLSERFGLDPLVAVLFVVLSSMWRAQRSIRSIIGLSSGVATIRCEDSRSSLASCSSGRSSSS